MTRPVRGAFIYVRRLMPAAPDRRPISIGSRAIEDVASFGGGKKIKRY